MNGAGRSTIAPPDAGGCAACCAAAIVVEPAVGRLADSFAPVAVLFAVPAIPQGNRFENNDVVHDTMPS